MARLTKLAVMIALGLQSLGATAISEQADTLAKGQFTSILLEIANGPAERNFEDSPDRTAEEMSVDAATEIVETAIDTLDDDAKTEANSLYEAKEYDDLEEFFMNNVGEGSSIELDPLFDALEVLLEAANGPPETRYFEDSPDRTAEEMSVDAAREIVETAIDTLDDDANTKAKSLYEAKEYDDLEEFFMNNVGEGSSIELDPLFDALEVLLEAANGPPETRYFEASPNKIEVDEEKELSELKETLFSTQEELKELLSHIDGV